MPSYNNTRTTLAHERHKPEAPAARPAEDFAFLNTAAWRKLSKVYLRAHPLCECCKAAQRVPIPPSEHCDHMIGREQGGAELDWANLMALCKSCHSTKTRIEVAGPMCQTVDTGSGIVPVLGGKMVIIEKINRYK